MAEIPPRGEAQFVAGRAGLGVHCAGTDPQVRGDARWVQPAGRGSRVLLRASLGALDASDFDALPPELRFFAGGDRSVRGFDFQAIGERNSTGGVIGGRNLVVASAEYEHYFLQNWGAAVFVDAGDAFTSEFNANVGAGIGLRWKSPVGVVRIGADRSSKWLDVVIHDDGRGLPAGFSLERSDGLGLQIVRTLVSVELNGSLGLHPAPGGGTDAMLRVPLGRRVPRA